MYAGGCMKSIAASLISIVFCVTAITAQESFIIDNCEDGNTQSFSGGWWYTYNDSINGGNSVVFPLPGKFQMSKSGYGNKGYAVRMKGTAGDKLGWDFFGVGVTLASTCSCPDSKPVDLREYANIQFKMKGKFSGGRLIIMLPYTENRCQSGLDRQETLTEWADYETALTGKIKPYWVTISLNLRKDFHQPKWVKQNSIVPIEKVLENCKNLNFQFSSPDGDSVDIWIDEIVFTK